MINSTKTTTKTIRVNGRELPILNTLSCGPGETPRVYFTPSGVVEQIGNRRLLQVSGQYPYEVDVDLPARN